MLSVLIETRDDEERLARTLASLVGAAVEGVVREVIVCDTGSADQTHRVAEHAGCHYLANSNARTGIGQARSEWLLLLEPGARLLDGWTEAVMLHAATSAEAARFTRSRLSQLPWHVRLFSKGRPLIDGLVITRRQALALSGGDGSSGAIARAVSTRRLAADIVTAPLKTRT